MRIGIFGGTFNPPHIGHTESAKAAARCLRLDRLIVVPAGTPPHKELAAAAPSAAVRLHMARLAFPDDIVTDIEVTGGGPSYTVDTVKSIIRDNNDCEMFLLVGTDMFFSLDKWKDSRELLSMATPAVFSRSTAERKKITEFAEYLLRGYGASTEIIDNKIIEIASSQLREMLPKRGGAGYISDTIYSYIIKNRFYGAKPDWGWLRERAYSMLDPARLPHVEGCEKEAVRLAFRWGADVDDAREAAILHDITKKLSPEQNLKILEEHGAAPVEIVKAEEKLFHSKTGALVARTEFGVTDTVADAIMWHTTGRAGMSVLEKVIYLADYIEPARAFEGVEELRELAYLDIDGAMKMGLEISVADMRSRGIEPNRTTFDALNDLNR